MNLRTRSLDGSATRERQSAIGKVYKHKSGQAPEKLTQRKAWQVKAFAFLNEHITSRSYTVESAVIPSTAHSASRASNEDSEDDSIRTSVSACDAQPESSTSVARRKSSALPKKKARRVDDALLDYLSRPRPSDNIAGQLESLTAPKDERAAFGQWVISRMAKVPNERWEQFQRAAFDLVLMWTRPPSPARQNQPQQHAQGYAQPYQQHAQGYSQCFTPQFQQRQPQGFTQQFSQVPPQMPPRVQSIPPALQSSSQGYPAASGLQSTPSLGSSPQLSEFSFATGFLHATQSPGEVERTEAGEDVASESGDGSK